MDDKSRDPMDKQDAMHENEEDDAIQKELQKLIEQNDLRSEALRKMINQIGIIKPKSK